MVKLPIADSEIQNLAAQGYLDVSYIALVIWALALEVERPRRGPLVLVA